MNNPPNSITFRHSIRLASDARECTIGSVIDQWSRRFESEGIPEPIESIEYIVAHIVGEKMVSAGILIPLIAILITILLR
jgi:release factor glutamine methyltransferase